MTGLRRELSRQFRPSLTIAVAAAAIAGTIAAGPAEARTTLIKKQGSWEAFGGTDESGTPLCGIITAEAVDRVFIVKRYPNTKVLVLQMLKEGWRISPDQQTAATMRFDLFPPWEVEALAMPPDGIRFTIPEELADAFLKEFGSAKTMRIAFPKNGDQAWELAVAGNQLMVSTMLECAVKLDSPGAAPPARPR